MASLFQTLGLSAALCLTACSAEIPTEVLDCARRSIIVEGSALSGIEDMAVLADGQLLLSAYNRRDRAASPKGLFALYTDQRDHPWQARRVTEDTLLPHGVDVSAADGAVFVIDRRTKNTPRILRYLYDKDTEHLADREVFLSPVNWQADLPYPCNLNDVVALSNGAIGFTNDRSSCSGFGRTLDNIFGRQNGSLWTVDAEGQQTLVRTNLYFPNGVAIRRDAILVAQTRAKTIVDMYGRALINVPAAPDNLTVDAETGDIWVAAIPSLLKYAFYRAGFMDTAGGTVIVQVEEDTHAYHVPGYSGGTTALAHDGHLYISGAYSDGIMLCDMPDV